MKKYLSTILALLFIAFISTATIAQDSKSESTKASAGKVEKKDDQKRETKKEIKKEIKKETKYDEKKKRDQNKNEISADKSDAALSEKKDDDEVSSGKPPVSNENKLSTKEEKSNKGNAYGKNKGDLEGKDFGQNRANEAKMKNEEKKKELSQSLSTASTKINDANMRIKKARANLERSYKDGKITEKEYEERMARIEKAEKKVKDLEEQVVKNKRLTN